MNRKILFVLLALSLGVNAGLAVVTLVNTRAPAGPIGPPPPLEEPGGPPGPGPRALIETHLRGVTRHLGLDPGQQAAIRGLLEDSAPALVEAQRRDAASRRLLSEVFAAPRFDADAFRRAGREALAARAAVDSISSELLAAEAAVLTPEQRVLFAEVVPSMHRQAPQRPAGDRPPPGGVRPRPRDGDRPPPR